MQSTLVFYGSVVNPVSLTYYEALKNCLLAVDPNGTIQWLVRDVEDSLVQEVLAQNGCLEAEIFALSRHEFIMPGFIDTHTHAPQVPNIGSGQQYELLDWLSNVTFPMEAQFSDPELAERTYKIVVRRIIDSGATTCCYYGTVHLEATKRLADIVHSYGQRAFIGKCNMDRNSPETYVEVSPEHSLEDTSAFIRHIKTLEHESIVGEPLVQPILTPRFAISCSSKLLESLGGFAAADPSLRIQTHISENQHEIAFTKQLFPGCTSYSGVYDSFGLLRANTILAHGVHLEKEDLDIISKRKAGISHCPTSNFNLSSGVAPIGEYLDRGIKVGLGTDVSGGFSTSILQAVRDASIAAKVISMQSQPKEQIAGFSNRQLSIATLLYLATLGGAQVCNLEQQIGSFAAGKSFDALVIDTRNSTGNPSFWGSDSEVGSRSLEDMLERFLFCGDDRNIARVYVQGRFIGGKAKR